MPQLGVTVAAGVATLTIDNAARRNSLTLEMWQQFEPILARLADDPVVTVLVIRGAGDNFSSGADIRDLPAIFEGPTDGGWVTEAEEAIAAFPKPTIAAIDGFCVGGGWEIAGACDIRLASSRATFGVTPARIGIVYPLSGIRRLVTIAGPAVAKLLLLTGELIDAGRAREFGMVTRVIEPADFWSAVDEFALELSTRSQLSTNAMKELVDLLSVQASPSTVADRLTFWLAEAAASDDPAIGAAAFLSHAAPHFTWHREPPVVE
jgi:enoyl-CoA hydratase/carnithine racemase